MKPSESQKKYLRGLGHPLKPLIMIGDAGLSDAVMAEFDSTIAHHELIKVKIRSADREARDLIIQKLCAGEATTLVNRIGNVALIYRANPDQQVEKRLCIPSR